jgi:hypothetical protein
VTFIGLVAILFWMSYEIIVSPVLKQQADVIKSSGDSVHSESSIPGGIAGAITYALPFLRFRSPDDLSQDDAEKVDEKYGELEESPTVENSSPDQVKMKLRGGVKRIGIINSALDAFTAVARNKKRRGHRDRQHRSKPRLHIDSSASVPPTELTLSDEPASTIELTRFGTIRDVAYSDDGKWLAVTW